MTEDQWRHSEKPTAMLRWLYGPNGPACPGLRPVARRPARRVLALLACAAARAVWHLLDDAGRAALAALEDDVVAGRVGTHRDATGLWRPRPHGPGRFVHADAAVVAVLSAEASGLHLTPLAIRAASLALAHERACGGDPPGGEPLIDVQHRWAAPLVRDFVPDPLPSWSPPLRHRKHCGRCDGTGLRAGRYDCVGCETRGWFYRHGVDPDWLTADVAGLVRAADRERRDDGACDPARLAVLSDALEEAGCPAWDDCAFCDGRGEADTCVAGCVGGRVAQPLLVRLRADAPLYRGAWPLERLRPGEIAPAG